MAAGNTRMTRSMAAAARDASNSVEQGIELKHEEPAVSLILINDCARARLTELCVENEGAQWLLANQALLHPEVPVYKEEFDVVGDQHAMDEHDEIMPRMRGGDSRAFEQVRCLLSLLLRILELTQARARRAVIMLSPTHRMR